MKKLLLLASLGTLFFAVLNQTTIDPTKTTVAFTFPKNDVKGSVQGFEGVVQLDEATPSKSKIYGQVDASTLNTGIWLRNAHLRTGSYFDVSDHPTMKFEATKVSKSGNKFLAKGPLTIKGTSKEVEFSVEVVGNTVVATATLYSSDFGISINKSREDNRVDIKIASPIQR
jgi:polyisoprenoid-binding protein YceI